jgi:signal transduction histidine kinase
MFRRNSLEMRVVILAPVGRDAVLLAGTLAGIQIEAAISADGNSLLQMLAEGAGAAMIADEALTPTLRNALAEWLSEQPPWSDTPVIVLTSGGRPTQASQSRARHLRSLGNLTLIERPVRPETVQSSVQAALRARMRQYEIRSRQEALIQANADLEQFAHSASHDLREPLRSIGIYSDLIARNYGAVLDDRGKEFLSIIQAGAKRMDALLSDLLSYAHASSILEETLEPIDARRPLEAALESLAGSIRESNANIAVAEMPSVKMHQSHLSQVFQNLIGNAIKYRNEHEPLRIEVSARPSENGHWVFRINDNGIGVPSTYKETIFGIFKRLHTNSEYSGTGMGLAICKRIVERYGGRIWVESEPGRGSSFFFTVRS